MLRLLSRFLFCVLLVSGARAASSLENARRAEAMLGPGTWTRVIRIENTAPHRIYPRRLHALVFEFGGLLWFYADRNGTQSLSLHTNNLEAEKADLAPLLRAIEPGFTTFSVEPMAGPATRRFLSGALPNGCFVESAAALRERVLRGDWIERARLLSFYGETSAGPIGHTVLTYETPGGAFVIDPQESDSPQRIGRHLSEDARLVAAAARPEVSLTSARWVPTVVSVRAVRVAAADGGQRAAAGTERDGLLQ